VARVASQGQLASRSRLSLLADGWRNLESAARSICLIRSRVRCRVAPTSSKVRGSPRSKP